MGTQVTWKKESDSWSVLSRIRHPERTVIRETRGSKTAGSSLAIVKASGALTVSMEMCNSCVLQGTLGKLVAFYYKTRMLKIHIERLFFPGGRVHGDAGN